MEVCVCYTVEIKKEEALFVVVCCLSFGLQCLAEGNVHKLRMDTFAPVLLPSTTELFRKFF